MLICFPFFGPFHPWGYTSNAINTFIAFLLSSCSVPNFGYTDFQYFIITFNVMAKRSFEADHNMLSTGEINGMFGMFLL